MLGKVLDSIDAPRKTHQLDLGMAPNCQLPFPPSSRLRFHEQPVKSLKEPLNQVFSLEMRRIVRRVGSDVQKGSLRRTRSGFKNAQQRSARFFGFDFAEARQASTCPSPSEPFYESTSTLWVLDRPSHSARIDFSCLSSVPDTIRSASTTSGKADLSTKAMC